MICISGLLYDGHSSRQIAAQLIYEDNEIVVKSEEYSQAYLLDDIGISPRIGNTPRFIEFPDGSRFETRDNDSVDQIEADIPASNKNQLVHRLESRMKYVAATLVFVIIFSWAFIQFGIPGLSKGIAFSLSSNVSQSIGTGTLELLDEWAFSESELSDERKDALHKKLLTVLPESSEYEFKLLFRKGNAFGANAFALPDGTIVFTDEIVELSQHDDELVSVMAHEVGHVIHRHNLRRLIQDTGLAIVVVAITGDVSTSSSLLLALPTLMVEASYSQAFETEADDYALEYVRKNQIEGMHFINLMTRLEVAHGIEEEGKDTGDRILDYFSSHPPTNERIKQFSPKTEQ